MKRIGSHVIVVDSEVFVEKWRLDMTWREEMVQIIRMFSICFSGRPLRGSAEQVSGDAICRHAIIKRRRRWRCSPRGGVREEKRLLGSWLWCQTSETETPCHGVFIQCCLFGTLFSNGLWVARWRGEEVGSGGYVHLIFWSLIFSDVGWSGWHGWTDGWRPGGWENRFRHHFSLTEMWILSKSPQKI